ncbi:hypothetical protein [Streptomyces aidingensis]|uniref:hypothetical protein n=1 Tax=Streptomyces aidingensis TaxID=910347 RepID=UPI001FE74AB2|nr:hypothetical protein [Streptomyces aidingensis]
MLGLAVTGCSMVGAAADTRTAGEAVELIRQVPDLLAEAGSSRARTAVELASGGTRITIHGRGGFDYRRRVGELAVTLPADPSAAEQPPVTELFLPGELYLKNRGEGVPPDKWVRLDVAAIHDGNLVTGGATDPITAAELLRGVQHADDLGEVEVEGETLRRFRGITDIAEAARAADDRESREQLAAAVDGFTDTAVRFDAYLDDDGVLRRIRHHFSFASTAPPAPGVPVQVSSTTVLYDFGTPVVIDMPPAEHIFTGAVAYPGG